MQYDDRILGGSGATHFARKNGFETFLLRFRSVGRIWGKIETFGTNSRCVVLDSKGKIAVATSTGGFWNSGRISDSATVAGNYANEFVVWAWLE
jgi:L-asparaginase